MRTFGIVFVRRGKLHGEYRGRFGNPTEFSSISEPASISHKFAMTSKSINVASPPSLHGPLSTAADDAHPSSSKQAPDGGRRYTPNESLSELSSRGSLSSIAQAPRQLFGALRSLFRGDADKPDQPKISLMDLPNELLLIIGGELPWQDRQTYRDINKRLRKVTSEESIHSAKVAHDASLIRSMTEVSPMLERIKVLREPLQGEPLVELGYAICNIQFNNNEVNTDRNFFKKSALDSIKWLDEKLTSSLERGRSLAVEERVANQVKIIATFQIPEALKRIESLPLRNRQTPLFELGRALYNLNPVDSSAQITSFLENVAELVDEPKDELASLVNFMGYASLEEAAGAGLTFRRSPNAFGANFAGVCEGGG
jgi:hypothetical protein